MLFGFGGFRRRHLPAADAVGDALLLVGAALAGFVVAVVLGRRVVLVVVDRLAEIILLLIDLLALLRRQRAAIGSAVIVNFLVQPSFAAFQILGPGGHQVIRRRRPARCGPAGCSGGR